MIRLLNGAMGLAVVLAVAAGTGVPGAMAQMSPDQVSAAIESAYGVEVLRIEEVETEGGTVYELVVMNAGGNFNEAFQVNRLQVDPATGKLISQFVNGPNGTSAGVDRGLSENSGMILRRDSF